MILKDGSMVFYHEGKLQSGEDFHVITMVPGQKIEGYFNFIASREDFPVKELASFGKILRCEKGKMTDDQVREFTANSPLTEASV